MRLKTRAYGISFKNTLLVNICTLLLLYYFRVRETVIEVEYPLVESQLKELDEQLEKAIHQLNWTSEGIHVFYVHPADKHIKYSN